MSYATIPELSRAIICFSLIFLCSWATRANDMPIDTVVKVNTLKADSIPIKKTIPYKIIPRQATLKSLMIPGWGQYYNRQYWKLPLVAGAFITLGIIANYNNVRYEKYRAYYYIASPHPDDPTYVPPATVAVPYEDGLVRDLDVNQLKRLNDGYRRNRDYTYIGMVLAWAFNVVDANVSAHLKTFDVSDDITLKIKPTFEYQSFSNGLVSGVSLSFNFKK
jgi:hypothetical protein